MSNQYYGFIYVTTNHLNNKKYIGKKTYDSYNRWKTYLGSGILLNRAIKKYGSENFSKEIIENCNSLEELNDREKYWINHFNAVESDDYYNCAIGGDGGNVIAGFTDEQLLNYKNKLSLIRKGKMNIGEKNGQSKKVICLNNMRIFNTTKEAADYGNTKVYSIQACCQEHYIKTAGTHPETNERLQWAYYEDGKEYVFVPFHRIYPPSKNRRRVIRLSDMKEYDSIDAAAKDNHLSKGAILYRCQQEEKTSIHNYDISFKYAN